MCDGGVVAVLSCSIKNNDSIFPSTCTCVPYLLGNILQILHKSLKLDAGSPAPLNVPFSHQLRENKWGYFT